MKVPNYAKNFNGGPVGIETMAAALSEQRDVLEEVIEPYLIQQGLLQRTPRGRLLTEIGFQYLGIEKPIAHDSSQLKFTFDGGDHDTNS